VGGNWRDRTATTFECRKKPAASSRGVVVSNHPLASAAGAACWRADGTPVAIAGGLAHAGVRFGLR
jgi:gamma-glutamyltranspeptidase/glutathione hydrolase